MLRGIFFFFKFQSNIPKTNSGDPDEMLQNAASGLGLHCLAMSQKKTLCLYKLMSDSTKRDFLTTVENNSYNFA